jgi:hypothetical protein
MPIVPNIATDSIPMRVEIKKGRLIGYLSEMYRACLFNAKVDTKEEVSFLIQQDVFSAITQRLNTQVLFGVHKRTLQLKTPELTVYVPTHQQDDVDNINERVAEVKKNAKSGKKGFGTKCTFTCKANDFLEAIGTVSSINIGQITPSVKLVCEVGTKDVTLTVAASHGKMKSTFTTSAGPKKSYKFGASSKYLAEMLGLLDKSEITVTIYEQSIIMIDTVDGKTCMVLSTAEL